MKQYSENTELVYVPGEPVQSKVVDDFGSFEYWREPVPTLDIASILNEVSRGEEVSQASPSIESCVSNSPTENLVSVMLYNPFVLS